MGRIIPLAFANDDDDELVIDGGTPVARLFLPAGNGAKIRLPRPRVKRDAIRLWPRLKPEPSR